MAKLVYLSNVHYKKQRYVCNKQSSLWMCLKNFYFLWHLSYDSYNKPHSTSHFLKMNYFSFKRVYYKLKINVFNVTASGGLYLLSTLEITVLKNHIFALDTTLMYFTCKNVT